MDLDLVRFITEQNQIIKDEMKDEFKLLREVLEEYREQTNERLGKVEKFNWKLTMICLAALAGLEIALRIAEATIG